MEAYGRVGELQENHSLPTWEISFPNLSMTEVPHVSVSSAGIWPPQDVFLRNVVREPV